MSRRRRGKHQENGSSEQEETTDADGEQADLGETVAVDDETADRNVGETGDETAAGDGETTDGDVSETGDDSDDNGSEPKSAETADVEVVDAQPPEQAEYVENARTYEFEENGVAYRVVPVIERGGATRWVVQANSEGVQGQLFRGEHIGDGAADSLGLSRETQDRINTVLEEANENMELPASLRGQTMENAPLSDLENALGGMED